MKMCADSGGRRTGQIIGDLLALRALAREPLHVVARIHDDPVERAGDREPVTELALLEPVRRTGG